MIAPGMAPFAPCRCHPARRNHIERPSAGTHPVRQAERSGGTYSLELSGTRNSATGEVHSHVRGVRAHCSDWRMGAANGMQARQDSADPLSAASFRIPRTSQFAERLSCWLTISVSRSSPKVWQSRYRWLSCAMTGATWRRATFFSGNPLPLEETAALA